MEKIIHSLIDNWTKGVDTYTHNGSTWLIFTDNKQWVIELTEQKTLWYNYNFFKQIFEFTSLDVVDNQHYITKWVEDNIVIKVNVEQYASLRDHSPGVIDSIIQNGVKETLNFDEKHTLSYEQGVKKLVEDTIKNGVKETINHNCDSNDLMSEFVIKNGVSHTEIGWHQCNNIDDAIEKGVKETMFNRGHKQLTVKNIIENGVKEIYDYKGHRWDVKDVIQDGVRDISPMTQYTDWQVEEIIENGVKETDYKSLLKRGEIEDIIQNGVQETNHVDIMGFFDNKMEDTLQNGVKETKTIGKESPNYPKTVIDDIINNGVKETNHIKNNVRETKQFEEHLSGTIDEVIKEGVKETKTPGNGDIASTAEWMKENNSTSYPKMIEDVIENGVKHTEDNPFDFKDIIEDVVQNGVKETKVSDYFGDNAETFITDQYIIDKVIENGVKETKSPGADGDILSTIEWMKENNSDSVPEMIDDVIENGVKKTHGVSKNLFWEIGDTIQNGVKKTISRENPSTMVDDIIKKTKADASQNPMGKVTEILRDGKINGTFVGGKKQKEDVESVIGYGTKNPSV